MMNALMEHQIEAALQDAVGYKATQIAKVIDKLAAQQGGKTPLENYQRLGKRALIACGVVLVTVEAITLVSKKTIARRLEERRVEATVRRVLVEEGVIEQEN